MCVQVYQNPDLPIEERIEDLLSKMTIEEKILQTDQYYSNDFSTRDENGVVQSLDLTLLHQMLKGNSVGSIQTRNMTSVQSNILQRYAVEKTRLGIPFLFSEEALHGLLTARATAFPQQIGLGATFNPDLAYKMGRAIATEARAVGVHETYSPVLDLARDPRFGRTEETYGEDVMLSSAFAREIVRGMQGDSLHNQDTVAAEPKHYVGYGSPVAGLNCAPSAIGRHEVFAECLPVFESAFVDGGAVNAMCSYNAIDGVPVAMDHELLTTVLRDTFAMPGFVRSDMTAVARLNGSHYIAPTRCDAIAMGLSAGVDLQLYDFTHEEWKEGILSLLANGKLAQETLDNACRRVLRVKFMLGLFDQPYTDEALERQALRCKKHQEVALEIARQSICLLKNESDLLPLSPDIGCVAVVGPSAAQANLGGYTEDRGRNGAISVLDAVRGTVSAQSKVLYERGCGFLGGVVTPFHGGMLVGEDGNPGLTGRYYNGRLPQGEPVAMRNDLSINFNWIYAGPHAELDSACFSVIWTGYVKMPKTVEGSIAFLGQDSVRVYIEDELLIDAWEESSENTVRDRKVAFRFLAEKSYSVRIEFTNDQRGARVMFGYCEGHDRIEEAAAIVREAEVAIVCLGDNDETSGENFDRTSLDLPGGQLDLLKALHETGTPIVLVLQSGRPVTLNWEQAHIPAILQAWFPGEQGGEAIAETLFGINAPSGRLPITFPRAVGQIPCHHSRKPGGGQRYVEMTWLPLYPFGYGLSYTKFRFDSFSLSSTHIFAGDSISVKLRVANIGEREGVALPQVYIRDCYASVVKPMKSLAAFARVSLSPGDEATVTLEVNARQMRTLGSDYIWRIEPGDFELMVGDNAENILWSERFTVNI